MDGHLLIDWILQRNQPFSLSSNSEKSLSNVDYKLCFCVSTVFDLACDDFSGLCDAICPRCNLLALLQVSLIIMKQGPFSKI